MSDETSLKRIVVGICGGSGAGKSYLAKKVCQILFPIDSIVIPQDCFYKGIMSKFIPEKHNFDHPDAIDWPLLDKCLSMLKDNVPTEIPDYSFEKHCRTGWYTILPSSVLILEGTLILTHSVIRQKLDLSIFLNVDSDIRLIRRLERDIKERERDASITIRQYLSTVKPMHDAFVQPLQQYADLILTNDTSADWDQLVHELLVKITQ